MKYVHLLLKKSKPASDHIDDEPPNSITQTQSEQNIDDHSPPPSSPPNVEMSSPPSTPTRVSHKNSLSYSKDAKQ